MECPKCKQAMRLAGSDVSHNWKTGTNYDRQVYICDADDAWITVEIPNSPEKEVSES